MLKWDDEFNDIVDLKEKDGSNIEIPTDLLCECLELWARQNLSRPSLSVFVREANENDLESYEIAIGKAVLNEFFVKAVDAKIAEDKIKHCCGEQGFNPMKGDTCPVCESEK